MAQLRESLRKKEVESQSEKEELKQALRKREEDYKRVKSYAIRFKVNYCAHIVTLVGSCCISCLIGT